MALTDTFVKSAKSTSKLGEKHSDGGGLYLLVKDSGKYWRMNYRFGGKQKTLALGVYPAVSLKAARDKRAKAKEQLAAGDDPSIEKRKTLAAKVEASQNTFEIVARAWLKKSQVDRAASTQGKVTTWLEKDVFPHIGKLPIADIRPRDVLGALRHMERRGALESVQRVKQICGQVFRFAVAEGSVERDVTQDLKGALEKHKAGHHPAITDPKQAGELMRAIYGYTGTPYTVAAIKLLPLVFVRPGELRTAEWTEIDLEAAQWRIPAVKMKMKTDHIVPLSAQALVYRANEILEIADTPLPSDLEIGALSAWVQHQRLRIDARKWIAARLSPKNWGDKVDVTVNANTISIRKALEDANQRVIRGEESKIIE